MTDAELTEYDRELAKRSSLSTPTANGRAIVAVVFYRARDYWPDFFDISDEAPMSSWAELFDSYAPLMTPDIAERAVDAVAAAGVAHPVPGDFLAAARLLVSDDSK